MRRGIALVLTVICLLITGCSRHILLERHDRYAAGLAYECGEQECKPVDKVNPADESQSGTSYRTLPTDCGPNGIAKILIRNAGSKDLKVTAACAAPSQDGDISTMNDE